MSNLLLGWPIYNDASVSFTPSYSGGSWSSSLPLTNLSDRRLSKVARSASALAAATQFDVDLGTARTVGLVAIPRHTMTSAGTVRVRGYTTAGHVGNVYDSGTITPFPAGLIAEDVVGLNVPFTCFPAAISARYWLIELTDVANPAGYVDVARLVIAKGFTPTINANFGAVLGLETETQRLVTDGGSALYNTRPLRRTLDFVLDNIAEAEAFASYWRMGKQLGIASQVFVCYDPADTTLKHDRQFLAVMRKPSALVNTWVARYQGGVSLVEEL